jgi:hypothetical protein
MRELIWEYIVAVATRWWAMVSSVIGIIGLIIDLKQGFDPTIWIWIGIIAIPLFIAQFLAYKKLWIKLEKSWIRAYMVKYWNLPPVPSFMSGLVLNYSPGMLVSKNMQLITPSAQFWKKLLPSEKDSLLQLVEWLGQDPRNYKASIKAMSPPGGTSIRLHRK